MNLLRTSRIDPTKSAYHQLHGHKYDWNAHPLAPPGTKAIVYLRSWEARGVGGWYCSPALDHYTNMRFYIPAKKAYRTSDSFDLFPQHCMLPELSHDEHAIEVYDELVQSIQRMQKHPKKQLISKSAKALRLLARNEAPLERVAPVPDSEGAEPIQRVPTWRRCPARRPSLLRPTRPTHVPYLPSHARIRVRRESTSQGASHPLITSPKYIPSLSVITRVPLENEDISVNQP